MDGPTGNFWEFMFQRPRLRADAFGDYIRLMRKGIIAQPRNVLSFHDLESLLRQERVDADYGRLRYLWASYHRACQRSASPAAN